VFPDSVQCVRCKVRDMYCWPSRLLPTYCRACITADEECVFPQPTPAIEASEADADRDAKEAMMNTAVATVEVPSAMEGVQATEGTEGSIIELSLIPEERVEGDHMEGVSQQHKQFERELREATPDHASLAAKEAVARVLGEDSDMQEVSGASAMATAAEPVAMEGVWRTEEETVLRQG